MGGVPAGGGLYVGLCAKSKGWHVYPWVELNMEGCVSSARRV